mgnify:CR=1
MKKFLFLFLVVLIVFNILNIIDKITTYIGVTNGLGESNQRILYFFNNYGFLSVTIFQILFVLFSSTLIYLSVYKISERLKYFSLAFTIPILFLINIYSKAVINNLRLIL